LVRNGLCHVMLPGNHRQAARAPFCLRWRSRSFLKTVCVSDSHDQPGACGNCETSRRRDPVHFLLIFLRPPVFSSPLPGDLRTVATPMRSRIDDRQFIHARHQL
jgi:hypothetical protein